MNLEPLSLEAMGMSRSGSDVGQGVVERLATESSTPSARRSNEDQMVKPCYPSEYRIRAIRYGTEMSYRHSNFFLTTIHRSPTAS